MSAIKESLKNGQLYVRKIQNCRLQMKKNEYKIAPQAKIFENSSNITKNSLKIVIFKSPSPPDSDSKLFFRVRVRTR